MKSSAAFVVGTPSGQARKEQRQPLPCVSLLACRFFHSYGVSCAPGGLTLGVPIQSTAATRMEPVACSMNALGQKGIPTAGNLILGIGH
jgi:hypothetical protein